MKSTVERLPSPATGAFLFRNAALARVSSAEPLDELVILPTAGLRPGLLVLAFLMLLMAAVTCNG